MSNVTRHDAYNDADASQAWRAVCSQSRFAPKHEEGTVPISAAGDIHGALNHFYDAVQGFERTLGMTVAECCTLAISQYDPIRCGLIVPCAFTTARAISLNGSL